MGPVLVWDTMLINCPSCGTPLDISPEHFGQNLICPACKGKFKVEPPEQTAGDESADGKTEREG